jgi:2-polyprenyl-3-methyl-5-hydroxy-6-metoxy-1,4-benzoquinol methylase
MTFLVAERDRQPELMDQPDLDPRAHEHALRGLERINFWSGASRVFWPGLWSAARSVPHRKLRVLDLACGAGDVATRLWRRARRARLPIQIEGCDRSATALGYARNRAAHRNAGISFFRCDVLNDPLPEGYDVLINSLFLHHLEEPEAEAFLRRAAEVAGRSFMLSDLVRGPLGMVLAYSATRLLTRSRVVHVDGPLSVAGAFSEIELRRMAARAGLQGVTVTRHWPSRMVLTWNKS